MVVTALCNAERNGLRCKSRRGHSPYGGRDHDGHYYVGYPRVMARLDIDHYFMCMADVARQRTTCDRRGGVGALLVVDRQVVATGYSGAIRGMPHCDDVGHMLDGDRCVRTVHAEMNALAQAARRGVAIDGATLYVTTAPCWNCFRVLVNAGVASFVYAEPYRTDDAARIDEVVTTLGLELRAL